MNEPSSPVCYAAETDWQTTPENLRILVLGMGAIGGYVGGRLAEAGADVTFLVRERRLHAAAKQWLIARSPLGDLCLQPRRVGAGDPGSGYDLVILACKAYDLDSAIDAIAPVVDDDTTILPLLNGLVHLDALDARFSRRQVMAGFAHMALEQRSDGVIHHLNDFHRVVYGTRHASQKAHARRLAALGDKANLDSRWAEPIEQPLWDKFVFLATLAGATCLFRATLGEILHTRSGERFILDLLQECTAVASASGQPPTAETLADYRELLTDHTAAYTASMLRHMQRDAPTEAEHILGDMLRRADAQGIEASALALAYSNLQAYEHRLQGKAVG
ncbi:ketopantoate reductase family protein [Methylohalomonas lacus]|uniref:ketopantoate reductase family protein n=1 Tax=Methylohalomonas lacus TaxID=398773 RepID=UPI0021670210|nr:ketopantoate reductase family protein [Methylohalomonas lacus]